MSLRVGKMSSTKEGPDTDRATLADLWLRQPANQRPTGSGGTADCRAERRPIVRFRNPPSFDPNTTDSTQSFSGRPGAISTDHKWPI
jgi:hypothetical protein